MDLESGDAEFAGVSCAKGVCWVEGPGYRLLHLGRWVGWVVEGQSAGFACEEGKVSSCELAGRRTRMLADGGILEVTVSGRKS